MQPSKTSRQNKQDSETKPVRQMKQPVAALATFEPPLLMLQTTTPALMDRILYWTPPVADWVPLKKTKNSSLRIACIAEDRVAHGLEFEGEILILTPGNWETTLRYASPDFLLIESIWISNTGHWHMGQHPVSPEYGILVSLIKLARELAIPTVFWITKGNEYHEHYKEYAKHFDLVCCADPLEVDKLEKEGLKAELLLPCTQPALYNPFRYYEQRENFGLNILFDGWADIDRLGEKLAILKKLKPFGLSIIESRYQLFRNRLEILPEYKTSIRGCVTRAGRLSSLKYAQAYATADASLSSKITQQWMSLEAAASRLPVVHCGALTGDDMRRDYVIECAEEADYLVEFIRYREDDLYRERVAHLGWRTVNQHHTFAHRIRSICKLIGVKHGWEEYPKASLITPTYRKDLLSRCVQTFDQIAYPNKELILVFNGDTLPTHQELGLEVPRADVVISHAPSDMFAGATLNMGHLQSTGEYCFRIDDDDYYGSRYILDMILQARSVDATLFGKPSVPLAFEGERGVYVKKGSTPHVIATQKLMQSGALWFGGNSISGTKEFFTKHHYSVASFGAADTDLVLNLPPNTCNAFVFMDQFNLVAERRHDLESHTWKYDRNKLALNRVMLKDIAEIMV